ncbi:MAG: 4-hydroxy-tetrahydrodipicolinate synthase [Bacteroidia bacterium]|nr:4-hydroxy-tetrahydrodipicolinate synthase [Bacteroidia bacterium]
MFTGTGVALVTPFLPDGELDLPALRTLVQRQIDGGADYLAVLGTTGEPATLTEQEQRQVIETVSDAAQGRIPLVLGAGGNDTAAVCMRFRRYTEQYRPAGLLSVSPYYNKPTQEGIYRHYRALADCTDLPVIIYNVPGRTASNISAETTLRIARDCPNIAAVKEASGNVEQIMQILRERPQGFGVISGDDLLTLPLMAAGCEGVISVIANAFPEQFSAMVRAARAGDFAAARRLHYALMPATQLAFAEGNPAGVKMLLHLQGLMSPQVRLPLVSASDSLKLRMQQALQVLSSAEHV